MVTDCGGYIKIKLWQELLTDWLEQCVRNFFWLCRRDVLANVNVCDYDDDENEVKDKTSLCWLHLDLHKKTSSQLRDHVKKTVPYVELCQNKEAGTRL